LDRAARPSLDTDIFPYGLAANRMVIEKAMEFSHEQGLTPRVMTPEEVYAPTMLDT
jgi:4,5-dihydroxyphthalate decarboxylase